LGGSTYYYNVHSGELSRRKPAMVQDVRGGILAEEMGLGKSVRPPPGKRHPPRLTSHFLALSHRVLLVLVLVLVLVLLG
jgi:hypothetical protein